MTIGYPTSGDPRPDRPRDPPRYSEIPGMCSVLDYPIRYETINTDHVEREHRHENNYIERIKY
jgi:hypothetical protein